MNPSKFMDKQITELSPSTIHDFPYVSDLHEEEDEEDHLFPSSNFLPIRPLPVGSTPGGMNPLRLHQSSMRCFKLLLRIFGDHCCLNSSSMDRFDSAKAAHEKVGTSYDGALISVSRTRNIESYVDELKASTEYNHGRTNGKLKQLENTLRENSNSMEFENLAFTVNLILGFWSSRSLNPILNLLHDVVHLAVASLFTVL
ncbi:hypothetical protein CK203_006430 [Vitis vinifera]|uniref:Uncharacterized protein n=1 Tax=Vitis vinifera TaxID=29760 RepID=A0A438KAH7_VITVI|nr:hypothetical protein CK203_006430 [Vitis vinifera]